jgi:putative oxidoreductase
MQLRYLLRPTLPIAALRMVVGVIFILHAAARIYNDSLTGFGDFLNQKGFLSGFYLAWTITVFELAGGICMFFRRFVKIFCIGEMFILIGGIVLVHWPKGRFIEDMSIGGIEYSIVLITILLAIFLAERKEERNIAPLL